MQEINTRFAFLEKIIEEERSQNKKLFDAVLSK